MSRVVPGGKVAGMEGVTEVEGAAGGMVVVEEGDMAAVGGIKNLSRGFIDLSRPETEILLGVGEHAVRRKILLGK